MNKTVKKTAKRRRTNGASRSAGASRVRKHRAKMKALGLKPVLLWVRDLNDPIVRDDIRRQCERINASKDSAIVLDGMIELADLSDWKA